MTEIDVPVSSRGSAPFVAVTTTVSVFPVSSDNAGMAASARNQTKKKRKRMVSSWIAVPGAGARGLKNLRNSHRTPRRLLFVVVADRPLPAPHPERKQDDTRGRSPGSRVLVLVRLPGAK